MPAQENRAIFDRRKNELTVITYYDDDKFLFPFQYLNLQPMHTIYLGVRVALPPYSFPFRVHWVNFTHISMTVKA